MDRLGDIKELSFKIFDELQGIGKIMGFDLKEESDRRGVKLGVVAGAKEFALADKCRERAEDFIKKMKKPLKI